MSLLTDKDHFIADMWPAHLPRLLKDVRFARTLESRDIVPDTTASLTDWARVISNPDRFDSSRKHILVHNHPPDDSNGRDVQVAFRLQGFVQRLNIKPTGNWTCAEQDAHRATQYVVLSGGQCPEVFDLQRRRLAMITEVVLAKVGSKPLQERERDHIYLPRLVFTKVRPNRPNATALRPVDDPNDAASKIIHKWFVEKCLDIGRQEDSGRIMRCTHSQIRLGDFVDVTVTAEIQSSWTSEGLTPQVFFKLQRIILLKTAASIRSDTLHSTAPAQYITTYDRINFDDDTEEGDVQMAT